MSAWRQRLERGYHAAVPRRLREPLGRVRRWLIDRTLRARAARPLPPAPMLAAVQMTPWVMEYLEVGRRSARALTAALADLERDAPGSGPRILDFGCGLGRTLHHLEAAGWRLTGCDVDRPSLVWAARSLPFAAFVATARTPPLPFPAGTFDGAYAVSVFSHFSAAEQTAWRAELARVIRPGGVAAVSTMGPRALESFGRVADADGNRERLIRDGFLFHRGGEAFNQRGAFHTREGVARIFAPCFALDDWRAGGLDGFQDLSRLIRTEDCG